MENINNKEYELNYTNFINVFSDILNRNQDLFLEAFAEEDAEASFFIYFFIKYIILKNNKRRIIFKSLY